MGEVREKRAAMLTFELNAYDRRPRRVFLIEELPERRDAPLPFTWRFLNETKERHYPVITIVAARGVSIELDGFPEQWLPLPGFPALNIYRVQDPAILPRLATDPPGVNLCGSYDVSEQPLILIQSRDDPDTTVSFSLDPDHHFKVDRFPLGVSILHFGSGEEWTITVPELAVDRGSGRDARAGFAYEIDTTGVYGDRNRPMLKIVKTPEAELTVQQHGGTAGGLSESARALASYSAIWEVRYLDQIVMQGLPIVPQADWKEVERITRIPSPEELEAEIARSLFDVALGLIPGVGDVIDIAEYVYGTITGKDRWGRALSSDELALMGLGAILPFASSAALRGGTRLVRHFGERAQDAASLARRVRDAGLSRAEVEVIESFEELVRAGRQVPAELISQASSILRRVPSATPSIGTLLNREGTGFVHADLQEAYRRYVGDQVRRGRVPADAAEWARRVTGGRPRVILEALLGRDYARRAVVMSAGPPINLIDVPRPLGYTDKLIEAQKATATGAGARLYERLGALLEEAPDAGAEALGLLRRQVEPGRFRIFKGNLAEVFAEPLQRDQLRRIAQRHPDARLVSGVRIRLKQGTKLSPRYLFTDNIIVAQRQGRLEVLAVFEVKAGFRGGQEATEQIFEWIERRLTDGSELIIPKGARFLSPDGRVRAATKDLSFTWHPGRGDVPVVTGLANAERHLVTARGASLLGIDSAMGVAGDVVRHELAQSSEELDYLAAELLSGRVTPRPLRLGTPSVR
jgi:hypothetical protein